MFFVSGPSAWRWETSGGGGISLDVVAMSGGVLKLFDPKAKRQVFHYGGVGAGLSTPGLKVPKLGGTIGRWLTGRSFNGSGAATSLWNDGFIMKGTAAAHRELTRADFVGPCIMGDVGISSPIKGRSFGFFLCGLNPQAFIDLTNPALMIIDTLRGVGPLNPSAVIGWQGDTRGLVAGGTGYLGYIG